MTKRELYAALVAAGATLGVLHHLFGWIPLRLGRALVDVWDRRSAWTAQLVCVALRHRWGERVRVRAYALGSAYEYRSCGRCPATTRKVNNPPKRGIVRW